MKVQVTEISLQITNSKEGVVHVKELLDSANVQLPEGAGYAVYRKRLWEDNNDYEVDENNGVITYAKLCETSDPLHVIIEIQHSD